MTQRIATMTPTMMKNVSHIYAVEDGGWKKVVKIERILGLVLGRVKFRVELSQ